MKTLMLIALSMLLTAGTVFAQGQDRGNGSDEIDDSQIIAWLVGNPGDEFKYCLKIAKGFNYDSTRFKARLDRALTGWERYFQEKKIYAALQPNYSVPLTHAREVNCKDS